MSDRTTTLREMFKAPEGQTLTGDQQLLYAKAYADAIATLSATADPNAFVANLRARAQQHSDLADLVEQYLSAADAPDADAEDEDEEEDAEGEDAGDKPKE